MRRDHADLMEQLARAVGRRVRCRRLALPPSESTLVALSRRTGMSVSFLSMIENGQRLPSLGALASLSKALGAPASSLLEVADEGSPSERGPGASGPVGGGGPQPSGGGDPAAAELLEPVAAFFRARGLGEREVVELLAAARRLFG